MRVQRQTVDLSAYPDLVVISLGMRVHRPRGLVYLLGLGPQILSASNGGPAPSRTGGGGNSSSRTQAAPAFGMRPTSWAAASKRSMTIWLPQLALRGSRQPSQPAARCSQPGTVRAGLER
jgi:hypothetical protein